MQILAISDIHLGFAQNQRAWAAMRPQPGNGLLLAGDVGDSLADLRAALEGAARCFAKAVWVPGNHELYTVPTSPDAHLRGVERYEACVKLCREYGVLTPEDPYEVWQTEHGPHTVAPLFLLYDHSFRPPEVRAQDVTAWAAEAGLRCNDDVYLHAHPYPDVSAWCRARCALTEPRLAAAAAGPAPLILVNHYPLRRDLVRLPRVPRLAPWCGTAATADWPARFGATVVVTGHLHVRATDVIDGVRHEEVSLGSPRDWQEGRPIEAYLRPIMPPAADVAGLRGTLLRYRGMDAEFAPPPQVA